MLRPIYETQHRKSRVLFALWQKIFEIPWIFLIDWVFSFSWLIWQGFILLNSSLIWQGISYATPWKWNSLVHSTLFLSECGNTNRSEWPFCLNVSRYLLEMILTHWTCWVTVQKVIIGPTQYQQHEQSLELSPMSLVTLITENYWHNGHLPKINYTYVHMTAIWMVVCIQHCIIWWL